MPLFSNHGLTGRSHGHNIPGKLRRRALFSWLSLLALLFNLAGALATPAAAARVDDAARVLCTAGGMVALPHEGESAPATAEAGGECVFCLPLLHGGPVPLAAEITGVVAVRPALYPDAEPADPRKPRRLALPASPRAPPL